MSILTFLVLLILVAGILTFFQKPLGRKVGKYLPTPFWVYFLSIVLGSVGLLPQTSPVYSVLGLHALPLALILLLIGVPISSLLRLGPMALSAMGLGMASMFVGVVSSFLIFLPWLPSEGPKMAGAMLGTWTGGSANLLSVKEIVGLSDNGLVPLIVADTFLSYGWLALLIMGVAYQKWFDRKNPKEPAKEQEYGAKQGSTASLSLKKPWTVVAVFFVGLVLAEIMILIGQYLSPKFPFLSVKAWAVLLSTTSAVLFSLTKLRKLEDWGASKIGTFVLYMVLATIGAKTQLGAAKGAGIVLLFGAVALIVHGSALMVLGRFFKLPMFLLATASQANVGGPVSAPIVAGVYKPGAAHIGVLMAILGAIFGTYIGGFGGWVCQILKAWSNN
ncbi:hypothetical protein BVX98_00370 [bacterium F11]|nr:hypothetical protein BVX98_00370 [bacterium F11]